MTSNQNEDLIKEMHDKNINFLIGSGASAGALPTLDTNIKKDGDKLSFEDIITELEGADKYHHSYLLFYELYFNKVIAPSYIMNYDDTSAPNIKSVSNNYIELMKHIINLIRMKKTGEIKRCNIFTTNYDGFIENAAESLLNNINDFILNDGCLGFKKKILSASNFNMQANHIGVFDSYVSEIPIVNLIKLHGSIYWKNNNDQIEVNYFNILHEEMPELSKTYTDGIDNYDDLSAIVIDDEDVEKLNDFWGKYKKIPVVNPTKWKFNETVFEQHYYQMLRLLSYELEKKNVYLIVFGFSFKDEHIYELVKRSLLNPYLTVFIFCFNNDNYIELKEKFANYKNIFFVLKHSKDDEDAIEELRFDTFNNILSGEQDEETWKVV